MTNYQHVKRGEIYMYNFGKNEGSIQSGYRPVLVIQSDLFNEFSSTTVVAAITTAVKKTYLPSHIYLGIEFGLMKPSMVLLEQIRTINQEDLGDYLGFVDDMQLQKEINAGLRKTFALWNYAQKKTNHIQCLCPHCMSTLREDPNLIIKRLNPFQKNKAPCDICKRFGYDYVVSRKAVYGGLHHA